MIECKFSGSSLDTFDITDVGVRVDIIQFEHSFQELLAVTEFHNNFSRDLTDVGRHTADGQQCFVFLFCKKLCPGGSMIKGSISVVVLGLGSKNDCGIERKLFWQRFPLQ